MYTYRNGLRTLTGILCIAVTIFIFTSFANADDEVQYKSYDLKGYSGSVEVDQSVQDKIQDKAIKEIARETKSKTIRITAMENLSEENLQASEEEALYVYTDKGLTHIQVDKGCVGKISLKEVKEMIHENEGSFVRVYDVGTQEESASFLSEHKGILATIGIAVLLILLWLLYERKKRRAA